MTQEKFDQLFDRTIKKGVAILLFGIFLMMASLILAAIFDTFAPFFCAAAISIGGGIVCVGTFAWDIFCNPRWRR